MPDAKTLARIGQAIGGEVVAELHRRLVEIGQEKGVVAGLEDAGGHDGGGEQYPRYPTDSSLLGDGARVLTRTMKKIEKQAGKLKRKVRDRTRSVRKQVAGDSALRASAGERGVSNDASSGMESYCGLSRQILQTIHDG